MVNISFLLEEVKASPYEEIIVAAPQCGEVTFPESLEVGEALHGPMGTWKEKPGTLLATMVREHNFRLITCPEKGELMHIHRELNGQFVEAGTELARFRHFLSKDEVLKIILKKALYLFLAPERGKYYFVPSIDTKVKVSGSKAVTVREGDELFIMSRMKRETSLRYFGPEGVIYATYFSHNQNIDAGEPLIGICSPELVEQVEGVVACVQTEWKE